MLKTKMRQEYNSIYEKMRQKYKTLRRRYKHGITK